MTAINTFRTNDCVEIYADTAITDLNKRGEVVGFGAKVIPIPHINGVFACAGHNWLAMVIAGVIAAEGYGSFDNLVDRLPNILQDFLARDALQAGSLKAASFECVLVGVSESRGEVEAYVMANHSNLGFPAWFMMSMATFIHPPVRIGQMGVEDGLKIMQRQREEPCRPSDHAFTMHAIGGDAVHVKVTKDGVTFKTIHRWGDAVGQKIDPKLNPVTG